MTYNYDRSLEAYLYHALIARFDLNPEEALVELQRIPIIHVHGILGAFPEIPYAKTNDVNSIRDISKSINIIHEIRETQNDFCNAEFRAAYHAITDASKVIFLGFGFHRDNIRRLKVDWSSRGDRQVFSTFLSMSPQEYRTLVLRLSEFGLSGEILRDTGGYGCDTFFRFVMSLE